MAIIYDVENLAKTRLKSQIAIHIMMRAAAAVMNDNKNYHDDSDDEW